MFVAHNQHRWSILHNRSVAKYLIQQSATVSPTTTAQNLIMHNTDNSNEKINKRQKAYTIFFSSSDADADAELITYN